MSKTKTHPRRVNFFVYEQDHRVLKLSARLLTDDTIARLTNLTVHQVRYRRAFARLHKIAVDKRAISHGLSPIGRLLTGDVFETTDLEKAIEQDLISHGLYQEKMRDRKVRKK